MIASYTKLYHHTLSGSGAVASYSMCKLIFYAGFSSMKYYMCSLNPTMSRISLISHEAEVKQRPSVNIKDTLQMQVGFNLVLGNKLVISLHRGIKFISLDY